MHNTPVGDAAPTTFPHDHHASVAVGFRYDAVRRVFRAVDSSLLAFGVGGEATDPGAFADAGYAAPSPDLTDAWPGGAWSPSSDVLILAVDLVPARLARVVPAAATVQIGKRLCFPPDDGLTTSGFPELRRACTVGGALDALPHGLASPQALAFPFRSVNPPRGADPVSVRYKPGCDFVVSRSGQAEAPPNRLRVRLPASAESVPRSDVVDIAHGDCAVVDVDVRVTLARGKLGERGTFEFDDADDAAKYEALRDRSARLWPGSLR